MTTLTVYWQPGCTSCLKTREFLRAHGVEFESVNVREDPQAMTRLAALGARSVPVVVRDCEFVYGQDLATVACFVGIDVGLPRLEVPVLVSKLLALLDTSAALVEQLPADVLPQKLPGRERTHLDLAYHVSQIVVGFLDAALGGRLTYEHFERKPPEHMTTAADAARLIRSVTQALAVWWGTNQSRLPDKLDTYYGWQSLHGVLERTAWHVAQHARQLERLLELGGVAAKPSLSAALLAGLPLPQDVWDAEVPLT
jgi:glutaredoxin